MNPGEELNFRRMQKKKKRELFLDWDVTILAMASYLYKII